MKKKVWLLGVAVAALTSCTENEVLDVPKGQIIAFESHVDKATRTADINLAGLTNFYTYGAYSAYNGTDFDASSNGKPLFSGTAAIMSKVEDSNVYSYPNAERWIMNQYYHFAGYSDGNSAFNNVSFFSNEDLTVQKGENGQGQVEVDTYPYAWGLKITDYEASTKDLIASVPMEYETVNYRPTQPDVNMTFKHLLSKISFHFSYNKNVAQNDRFMRIKTFDVSAIKKASCNVFYYGVGGDTYVDWNSQFKAPSVVDEAIKGNYTFFNGDGETEVGYQTIPKNNINDLLIHYIEEDAYVIPQKTTGIVIPLIEVETYYKENGVIKVTKVDKFTNVSLAIPELIYWKPGYVYRYSATLSPGQQSIVFTASVDPWFDQGNRDYPLQ